MLLMLQVVSTTTETTDGSVSQEKQKILVLVLTIQYGLLEQTKKEVDMVSTDLTIAPTNGRKFQDLHSELMLIRMVMLGLQTIRNKSTHTMAKKWIRQPGGANDIGVGADGTIWAIGTNGVGGGFGIYRKSAGAYTTQWATMSQQGLNWK